MEKQSSAKGFTVLSAASIINKLLGVLYFPVVALILGMYGTSIYYAGYTIYQLVFVITNSGIPIAISKLISEQTAALRYDVSYRTFKIAGALLALIGTLTSILTAVFANDLSTLVGWPQSYLTILALSPTMLFTAVSCIFRGYFQGRSNMVPTSISQIIEQAVNSALTILFAWILFQYGQKYAVLHNITDETAIIRESARFAAAGATIGTSLGALASAIYLFFCFLKKKNDILSELPLSVSNGRADYPAKLILKKILQYAIPITLGSVAIYTTQLIDLSFTKSRLIAGGFSEAQAMDMYGVLSAQYLKVLFIPVAFATALGTTIIPSISAAAAVNDRKQLGRRISKSIRIILAIAVPAAAGMTALAKPIINILYPMEPVGWDLLAIGSWILILISLVSIQTSILQGIGKTYVPTIHMVIGLVLKLIVNYSLISVPSINIKGAIIGNAVCYVFAAVMNYRAIKKLTRVRLNVRKLFNRPLSISVIMGFLVFLVYYGFIFMTEWFIKSVFLQNLISGCISIAAGGLVFYLLMIATGGITAEEIRSFPMGGRILAYTQRIPFMDRFLDR